MASKSLVGKRSQNSSSILKPNGSLGHKPYAALTAKEAVGANPSGSGLQTARMKVEANALAAENGKLYKIDVLGGSVNDNYGFIQTLTPKVYRYGVVNFRVEVYFPSSWDFTAAGSNHLKFLRIHTQTSAQANIGYLDVYVNDSDRALWFIYEGVLVWKLPLAGYELRYDTWETIEFRVVLDTVPFDSGGQARSTVWVLRGNTYVKIIDCKDQVTLLNATDECDRVHLFTYWNGNAPKDQFMYTRRTVICTDPNLLITTADGLKIIGGEAVV